MKSNAHAGISSQGREGLPDTLRYQQSPHREFVDASDPFACIEREALQKTESQRRGEQHQGSLMVKMDKPFPQLKPKNDHSVIRESFNRRWNKEVARAQREHPIAQTQGRAPDAFDVIEQVKTQQQTNTYDRKDFPGLGRER